VSESFGASAYNPATMTSEAAPHIFGMISRQEDWIIPAGARPPWLIARREGSGGALTSSGDGGVRIEASDQVSGNPSGAAMVAAREAFERDLRERFDSLPLEASRVDASTQFRLTLRGAASTVERDGVQTTRSSLFIAASVRERRRAWSLVTSPDFMSDDVALLLSAVAAPSPIAVDARQYPIVWRNGSAAVLLHEAIGHAAEHAAQPLVWPRWLQVDDVPDVDGGVAMGGIDDTGRRLVPIDLIDGGSPSARRRAMFSDLPITRMTNIVVRQNGAPWPDAFPRIEVSLVEGGRYDPLVDRVTITVMAAELVDQAGRQALQPFVLSEPRSTIAARLEGARGEPRRYPGVICFREGQLLVVGSFAADLLTLAMAP
jgi:hypothetical protein